MSGHTATRACIRMQHNKGGQLDANSKLEASRAVSDVGQKGSSWELGSATVPAQLPTAARLTGA
jgi:hypothetical protein